jgi:hypothetical protein
MIIDDIPCDYYRYRDGELSRCGVPEDVSPESTVLFVAQHDKNSIRPWYSFGVFRFDLFKFVSWYSGETLINSKISGDTPGEVFSKILNKHNNDSTDVWLIEIDVPWQLSEFISNFPNVRLDVRPLENKFKQLISFISEVNYSNSLDNSDPYDLDLMEDVLTELMSSQDLQIRSIATDLLAGLTGVFDSEHSIVEFIIDNTKEFIGLYLEIRRLEHEETQYSIQD